MRYVIGLLFMAVLAGCMRAPERKPAASAGYVGELARDAAAELRLHYPPAKTRLVLLAGDGFGRELLQILREEGYAVNENRGNGITIGYVVDQQPEGDIVLRLYLGDSVMLSRLYRLNPPGHGRVCFPVGAWSRRETEGVEGDA